MIEVELPDGSKKEFPEMTTAGKVATEIGAGLARKAVAARFNDRMVDLATPINESGRLEIITLDSPQGLEIYRHTTAHLMAHAVKDIYGDKVQVTIGPAIENGFYYDFYCKEHTFSPEDFENIETRMQELARADLPIQREEMTRDSAIALFREMGEHYKVELIEDLDAPTVSLYRQGDFIDLCRGPHLPSTGFVKAFKLTSVAGAYWRGSEKNAMLQRIYATAFPDKKELRTYLAKLEEARKRDHRRIGRELDLFSFSEEAGAGLVIWHPKGALLRTLLEDFERREHLRRGYDIVMGPQILRTDLWKTSGHFDNYRENMYFTEVDGQGYGLKPMNCLAHMIIYKSRQRSYRDLPLRYFELGTVHRHEKSGVLHGLLRVRGFTQDDAHILCTPEQLDAEIKAVLEFVRDVMAIFGFEYELEISTRPEKSIGSDEDWERATNALMNALKDLQLPHDINEGDGAFYGPKIDVKLKDALDRRWQCATIQCDFTLPERFDLTYVGKDGEKHRPVMLHRVILGAIERFIGVLIEHYAGSFPLWLSPVQATVINVTDHQADYAERVTRALRDAGVRVQCDLRNEKLGFKIREAQVEKIPYMLVVGDKEMADGTVAPRFRTGKNLEPMSPEDFARFVQEECDQYR
ncbi:MAG: threonine--tRNA ligase [Syntrophotalea acetylenica]|jgi:threonyl-tRNA synthetase|uniref:Threonine--tRNA ligase n=1 Tax=Syntrophotalea acetylenica TaxID=29542 RepID=A0A1L3GI94_SYNAC|nr:threonine--tRNA ligase [Syntrophotalea acetylenica]APG25620.1 threonine--tRNA ligase [Syntrophotalea acetylenica]APG43692.1 threonine--tRNA ligase [Syntrophotalea acetylenica]MDD4457274.1 threonine--tRNA ligase [Syntrophotalea acetylenica]MDY0262490.1 threonine--tRNA ligase [Syntrophotalea acetylenica]